MRRETQRLIQHVCRIFVFSLIDETHCLLVGPRYFLCPLHPCPVRAFGPSRSRRLASPCCLLACLCENQGYIYVRIHIPSAYAWESDTEIVRMGDDTFVYDSCLLE